MNALRPKRIFWRDSRWLDRPLSAFRRVLDLGAGGLRRAPHVTTVDILPLPETDVVIDLEKHPWPFAADSFDYIILSNVIEHIYDVTGFFHEVHRVAAPGGVIRGITPHFTSPCAYADPTHRHAFSIHFVDPYCELPHGPWDRAGLLVKKLLGCDISPGESLGTLFRLRQRFLYFREALWPTLAPIWANLFVDFYEVYLSRLLPAWAIYFELEVIKSPESDRNRAVQKRP